MSRLPNPQAANRLFQRHVTKGLTLTPEYLEHKVDVARQHLANWAVISPQTSGTIHHPKTLELGTGWMPLVPIAMALVGNADVTTLDVERLMHPEDIHQTLEMLAEHVDRQPETFQPDAAQRLAEALSAPATNIDAMLGAIGVTSIISDARSLDMPADTFDLFTSNNTFEHIPADSLRTICSEFRRVTRPDGGMSHLIDLKDHYAGFDASITVYNFLAYSESSWNKFNNQLQYQNRLRWSDYEQILRATGWTIEEAKLTSDVDALHRVDIDPVFAKYSEDDLAVHTAWVTSRPGSPTADCLVERSSSMVSR